MKVSTSKSATSPSYKPFALIVSVSKLKAFVKPVSLNQPLKGYPFLVGSVGLVAFVL